MSELETMIPAAEILLLGDETIEIRPINMGQVPKVLREIGHLMPLFQSDSPDIPVILMQGGEGLNRAAAIMADRPVSWVETLNMAQMAELVGMLLEVNLDFFIQQVAPAMQRLSSRMTGLQSSSGSRRTDMPAPTS